MSHLPPQAIKEFQYLYRKHVGEDLPDERAPEAANRVFNVLRLAIERQAAQATSPEAATQLDTDIDTPTQQ